MNKTKLGAYIFALISLTSIESFFGEVKAAYLPLGVQQNVADSTVQAWGFQVAYLGYYGDYNVPISTVFNSIPAGSYVMYAARETGSTTWTLLAAALESDVRTPTAINGTHNANGVAWYYNGYSMGFAPGGDYINQNSADTVGSTSLNPGGPDGALRLSWHTGGGDGNGGPGFMNGGWRVGLIDFLNSEPSGWERAVLWAPVPEPSTYIAGALLVLPFGLQGVRYLRNRNKVC